LTVSFEGFEETNIDHENAPKRSTKDVPHLPTHPNPSVLFWNQTHFVWISQSSHLHGLLLEGNTPIERSDIEVTI
jgi:hypothetical protein